MLFTQSWDQLVRANNHLFRLEFSEILSNNEGTYVLPIVKNLVLKVTKFPLRKIDLRCPFSNVSPHGGSEFTARKLILENDQLKI